jgi:hypothetical protein
MEKTPHANDRPFADPEKAARKLIRKSLRWRITGRISRGASPVPIANGWLLLHERGII